MRFSKHPDDNAPAWATWSLSRTHDPDDVAYEAREYGEVMNPVRTVTSLLRHRKDADITNSSWTDYKNDLEKTFNEVKLHAIMDDFAKSIESRARVSQTTVLVNAMMEKTEKILEDAPEDVNNLLDEGDKEIGDEWNGKLCRKFGPLSAAETRKLTQCLRLSKYVPAPPKADKASVMTEIGYYNGKAEHPYLDGIASFTQLQRARRTESTTLFSGQVRDKAKKRLVKAEQEKYVTEKQSRQQRDAMKNLCRVALPSRPWPWIEANLRYGGTGLIGNLPGEATLNPLQRARLKAAKEALIGGNLAYEDAAVVLYALSEASRLTLHGITVLNKADLSDDDDEETYERQRAESIAVTKVLKLLFPLLFEEEKGTNEALARRVRREAFERLEVVKQAQADVEVFIRCGYSKSGDGTPACLCERRRGKTYATAATQTLREASTKVAKAAELAKAKKDGELRDKTLPRPTLGRKKNFKFRPYESLLHPKKKAKGTREAKKKMPTASMGKDGSTAVGLEAPADGEPDEIEKLMDDDLESESGESLDDIMEEADSDGESDSEKEDGGTGREAKKEREPEKDAEGDDDSDWGDLNFEPISFSMVIHRTAKTPEEHRELYEQTMRSYDGNMPHFIRRKFIREARHFAKILKQREKEAIVAEKRKQELARAREDRRWARLQERALRKRDKFLQRVKDDKMSRAAKQYKNRIRHKRQILQLKMEAQMLRGKYKPSADRTKYTAPGAKDFQEIYHDLATKFDRKLELQRESAQKRADRKAETRRRVERLRILRIPHPTMEKAQMMAWKDAWNAKYDKPLAASRHLLSSLQKLEGTDNIDEIIERQGYKFDSHSRLVRPRNRRPKPPLVPKKKRKRRTEPSDGSDDLRARPAELASPSMLEGRAEASDGSDDLSAHPVELASPSMSEGGAESSDGSESESDTASPAAADDVFIDPRLFDSGHSALPQAADHQHDTNLDPLAPTFGPSSAAMFAPSPPETDHPAMVDAMMVDSQTPSGFANAAGSVDSHDPHTST